MPNSLRLSLIVHRTFSSESQYISTFLYLVDIPLFVTVGIWLLASLLDPSRPIRFGPWPITLSLGALVGLSGLSQAWALQPGIAVRTSLRGLVLFALYVFVINEIRDYRGPALALGVAVAVQGPIALGQFLARSPLGLFAWGEPEFYVFTPGASVIETSGGFWLRAYGLSPAPNLMAAIFVLGLFALLGCGISLHRSRSLAWLMVVGLSFTGLVATFSRSAWLGLAAGITGFGAVLLCSDQKAFRSAYWRFIAVGLGVLVAFVVVYPQLLATRFPSGPANELESLNVVLRGFYIEVARGIIGQHALTGVGAGNYVVAAIAETGPIWGPQTYQPVHNAFLLLFAELGVGGAIIWCTLWGELLLALWCNTAIIGRHVWWSAWTGAVIAVGFVSCFDHYLFTYQQGRVLLWVVLALWASTAGDLIRWPWSVGPARDQGQA